MCKVRGVAAGVRVRLKQISFLNPVQNPRGTPSAYALLGWLMSPEAATGREMKGIFRIFIAKLTSKSLACIHTSLPWDVLAKDKVTNQSQGFPEPSHAQPDFQPKKSGTDAVKPV